jgi:hypothetical protein
MVKTSTNQVSVLYKYKWNRHSGNDGKICASELVGQILLRPVRTKYRCGIFLTSQKWMNSRYLEDILSLGYTPDGLYSIDVNSLINAGFSLIDNEDQTLKAPLLTSNLTRVWPAFGQVGGASELIAVPDSSNGDCESYCLDFNEEAEMRTAPRFQILNADTVNPQNTAISTIYLLILQIIYNFFQVGEELNEKERFFVRIFTFGIVLKFFSKNLTISAGIKNMGNFCYGYLIGAQWSDNLLSTGVYIRVLETTAPTVFHFPCSLLVNQFNTHLDRVISLALTELRAKINNKQFEKREIELPKF